MFRASSSPPLPPCWFAGSRLMSGRLRRPSVRQAPRLQSFSLDCRLLIGAVPAFGTGGRSFFILTVSANNIICMIPLSALIAILFSIVLCFLLANSPETCQLVGEPERKYLMKKLQAEQLTLREVEEPRYDQHISVAGNILTNPLPANRWITGGVVCGGVHFRKQL